MRCSCNAKDFITRFVPFLMQTLAWWNNIEWHRMLFVVDDVYILQFIGFDFEFHSDDIVWGAINRNSNCIIAKILWISKKNSYVVTYNYHFKIEMMQRKDTIIKILTYLHRIHQIQLYQNAFDLKTKQKWKWKTSDSLLLTKPGSSWSIEILCCNSTCFCFYNLVIFNSIS